MSLFTKPLETIEFAPMTYNFVTYEDDLFKRIVYVRGVLANPNIYIGAPDKNDLNIELYGLLRKYQEIVMEKVNLNEVKED